MGISVKVIAATVATGGNPYQDAAPPTPSQSRSSTIPATTTTMNYAKQSTTSPFPRPILIPAIQSSNSIKALSDPIRHLTFSKPIYTTHNYGGHTREKKVRLVVDEGKLAESVSAGTTTATDETPTASVTATGTATILIQATPFSSSSTPPPNWKDPSKSTGAGPSSITPEVNRHATGTSPDGLAYQHHHRRRSGGGLNSRAAGSTVISSSTTRTRTSPERTRRDSVLDRVPEDGPMNFESTDEPSGLLPRTSQPGNTYAFPTSGGSSNGDGSDEETDSMIEEELETEGLYVGSYKTLVLLYSLVPIVFTLSFILLALLPSFVYPIIDASPSYPYSSLLPFPLPELLASIAIWSLSHYTREPLYNLTLFLTNPSTPSPVPSLLTYLLSTTLHSLFSIVFRQLTILLLTIAPYMSFAYPTWHDWAFRRVWWIGLGWSVAESVVAIKQGYEGIGMYKDVLVPPPPLPWSRFKDGQNDGAWGWSEATPLSRQKSYGATENSGYQTLAQSGAAPQGAPVSPPSAADAATASSSGLGGQTICDSPIDMQHEPLLLPKLKQKIGNGEPASHHPEEELENEVDRNLEQLNALKAREELEEVYGIPFIRIPIFISCLQRVNSLLLSLGFFLLLSSAYIRSTFAHPPIHHPHLSTLTSPLSPSSISSTTERTTTKTNTYLIATLPILILTHLSLEILHTPMVLPRIGVHTAVYIGLLVSLGSFFMGLAVWDALS